MPQFINTINDQDLKLIPNLDPDHIIVIQLAKYLQNLRNNQVTSYWGSLDTQPVLSKLKNQKILPKYALIIITGQMNPDCYLYPITKTKLIFLAELLKTSDPLISDYCHKLSIFCQDITLDFSINITCAMPI